MHYRIAPNLDPVRKAVIEALRTTLPAAMNKQLRSQLAAWKRQKKANDACAVAPSTATRIRELSHA